MDKEIKKSIELGFEGKITKKFYAKWEYTKKKRLHHLWELLAFIVMFFIMLWTYYIIDKNETTFNLFSFTSGTKFILIILIAVSLIAIWKNIRTWIDMFHVIKKRFDEYEKNRHR